MSQALVGTYIAPDHTYYSYDHTHGSLFWRHLGARLKLWRPYCLKCRSAVRVHERMVGMGVDDQVLIDHQHSTLVKRLYDQDWSVLGNVVCVHDWSFQPAIFVTLGRCETCDGPFALSAEIHGKASDGRIYVGSIFSSELAKSSGLAFLEATFRYGLLSSDRMAKRAARYCEKLDASKGTRYLFSLRERRAQGLRLGQEGAEYIKSGSYDQAEDRLSRALAQFEELNDERAQAIAKMQLGVVQCCRRKPSAAVGFLNSAERMFEDVGDKRNAALVRGMLAEIALERGAQT